MTLNKDLLDILACPKCKGPLSLLPDSDGLACSRCEVVYPVEEEIPIMLEDRAVPEKKWTGSRNQK